MTDDEITSAAARIWGKRGGIAHRESQTPAQRSAHGKLGVDAREEYRAMRCEGRGAEVEELQRLRRRESDRRAKAARRARQRAARREA
jgi:hypothetical protein